MVSSLIWSLGEVTAQKRGGVRKAFENDGNDENDEIRTLTVLISIDDHNGINGVNVACAKTNDKPE